MNVQVIVDAAGRLIGALTSAKVMTFADKAYQGARGSIRTPFKRHRYRPKLSAWQKKVNRAMERAAQVQLLAESAASLPVLIDPDVARDARRVSGTPQAGELGFRPLLEHVLHEEPDLSD